MQKGNKTPFRDKKVLEQMVKLRRLGYAESSLALMYGVDKSTIRWHFRRYGISQPSEVYTVERIVARVLPKNDNNRWKIVGGVRYSVGLSYKEYLAKAKLSP